MSTAAFLYKMQAHIAIPVVRISPFRSLGRTLVQLSSLVILQMDGSIWFTRLATSVLSERRLQFSIVALRMLDAEKTGNFRMLMPAPSEGTNETGVELQMNTYSFINPMSSAAGGGAARLWFVCVLHVR
jgi:hypothetical protein